MRLTLSLADFSGTGKNIGTLDSWFISKNTPSGLSWETSTSSVKKGDPLNMVAEIDTANYELVSIAVTMGATTQTGVGSSGGITISNSGSQYTIAISSVTANVNISVTTKNLSTGTPDSGGNTGGSGGSEPSTPVTPPVSGTSINVLNLNDSDLTWNVTTEAGNTTGEFVSDSTKGVSGYIAVNAGDVIRGGTYRNTTNTDGTNYYPYKSSPVYWYDANKTFLGATPSNPCFKESSTGSNDFILTVPTSPSGIAYFRVMINKSYSANIITINNPRPEKYIAYSNPTVLEGTISAPSSTINVFNPADTITSTTMDIAGTAEDFKAQSERGVSGFIACSGGDILRGATYRSGQISSDTNSECYPFKSSPVYFYDSALNYMSRANTFTGSGYDYKMTVPMGASYFRVMINTTYINTEIVTINNDLPETFVAYSAT